MQIDGTMRFWIWWHWSKVTNPKHPTLHLVPSSLSSYLVFRLNSLGHPHRSNCARSDPKGFCKNLESSNWSNMVNISCKINNVNLLTPRSCICVTFGSGGYFCSGWWLSCFRPNYNWKQINNWIKLNNRILNNYTVCARA